VLVGAHRVGKCLKSLIGGVFQPYACTGRATLVKRRRKRANVRKWKRRDERLGCLRGAPYGGSYRGAPDPGVSEGSCRALKP